MSHQILLDTNAYTDLYRYGKWQEVIANASKVILPIPVIAELRYGFMHGNRYTENEDELRRFLEKPSAGILAPDLETTHHYALIHSFLRVKGTPIPINDIWIAALSVQHGLWLCTSDVHFDHIPQLLRASS